MGLTSQELEMATKVVDKTFPATDVLTSVFPLPEENGRFLEALRALNECGAEIKAGGRRIRELLGCKVIDFAEHIVGDTYHFTEHDRLRLRQLTNHLEHFPTERMSTPDLDLFTNDVELRKAEEIFRDLGFNTKLNTASGGVQILEIMGSEGTASIIDSKDSWQTKPPWPMYGVMATYESTPEPGFRTTYHWGRMHLYQLEFSGVERMRGDPLDPARVAAVGRILLWALTATDPNGSGLQPPCDYSRELIYETVSAIPSLLIKIANDSSIAALYSSGLRDMAIALRIILLNEIAQLHKFLPSTGNQSDRFLTGVVVAWQSAIYSPLKDL